MGNAERKRAAPLIYFGGTFDPPHAGHLWLATAAVDKFSAEVRLIPNGQPPHRRAPAASFEHRLALCRLAAAGAPGIAIGEEEPPGENRYSIDTLRRLRAAHPSRPLCLLIGGDAWRTLRQWRQWDSLLSVGNIIVASRSKAHGDGNGGGASSAPDIPLRPPPAALPLAGGAFIWHCRPPAVSASALRRALAQSPMQRPMQGPPHLPAAVYRYIVEHRLYQ